MNASPEISLREMSSFGDVAAEDDAVLDYFLSTNAVDKIESNVAFLVLGRKGTGKTAIVRYFTEGSQTSLSRSLNLRGYPWNVHANRIDLGASEIEAYVSSWRYLIAVELSSLVLSHHNSSRSTSTKSLEKFLKDNYGSQDPHISDILRPNRLKLGKASIEPTIMGNKLFSIELNRNSSDHQFGLELNALSNMIIKTAIEIAQESSIKSLGLHFDELDQGLAELDSVRKTMLVGLILAAREVRRDCEKSNIIINPIVYLRTDLWEELNFSDKNKIHQTLTLHLGWNADNLYKLVEERLKARLSPTATWTDVIDEQLMRGSQPKWNHIIARTFLRPRDIISFLNSVLGEAKRRGKGHSKISNKDIVGSRDEYSAYLKKELDDEIGPHWPQWDEALRACSAISTITFEKMEFIDAYNSRKSAKNPVTADEALAMLYRFSVIGYERRSGYGGTSWVFQYVDPEAGWDSSATKFKVHLGLKEYAKLRETRQ